MRHNTSRGPVFCENPARDSCMKLAMSQTHIFVWDRLLLSAGPGRENSTHRHFGAILFLAPDAPITVQGREGAPIATQAALIAPNAWHRVDARASRVAAILVGPDHPWFCYVKPLLNGAAVAPLEFTALAAHALPWDALFNGDCPCSQGRETTHRILQVFGGADPTPHRLDGRISEVLQILRDTVVDTPTPDELGRRVGLSGYTLMRRFKAELGVRIREYVLWRRLMVALTLVDGRNSIAEIAQRTGFYDQAHLTRTVRRMVELAPSFITDFSQTRVHLCDG
jgi:AraC-like DNA-binding protein